MLGWPSGTCKMKPCGCFIFKATLFYFFSTSLLLIKSGFWDLCFQHRCIVMLRIIPFCICLLTRGVFVLFSLIWVPFDKICVLMKILNPRHRREGLSSVPLNKKKHGLGWCWSLCELGSDEWTVHLIQDGNDQINSDVQLIDKKFQSFEILYL